MHRKNVFLPQESVKFPVIYDFLSEGDLVGRKMQSQLINTKASWKNIRPGKKERNKCFRFIIILREK